MNLLRCTAIALVVLLVIPLAGVDAGSEKVAFPANFKSGVLYNVIDRDDQKEVHQQYTSREAVKPSKPPRQASPCPLARSLPALTTKPFLTRRAIP